MNREFILEKINGLEKLVLISGEKGAGKTYAAKSTGLEVMSFGDVLKEICGYLTGLKYPMLESTKEKMVSSLCVKKCTIKTCMHVLLTSETNKHIRALTSFGMTFFEMCAQFYTGLKTLGTLNIDIVLLSETITFARLLQLVGNEVIRTYIGPYSFVTNVAIKLRWRGGAYGPMRVVLADARFPEEINFGQANDAKMFRVVLTTENSRDGDGRDKAHASETALKDFNLPVIENDMTPGFVEKVKEFIH
jgi:hypothetical protein